MEKEKIQQLIKCYNDFIQELSFKKDIARDDFTQEEKEWSETPLEALDGRTPESVAEEIEKDYTKEQISELYRYVAENSFWSIPSFMRKMLLRAGKKAEKCILEILTAGEKYLKEGSLSNLSNEEIPEFELFVATLRLAPDMNSDEITARLFVMFEECAGSEEILDAFENAFIKTDPALVMELINKKDVCTEKESTPCQALVSSGKKSDEIFYCLKTAFKRSENKELFGMMLADYGDGRAVPVLRKEMIKLADIYAVMDQKAPERKSLFEALMLYNSFITSLGGSTKDIIQ